MNIPSLKIQTMPKRGCTLQLLSLYISISVSVLYVGVCFCDCVCVLYKAITINFNTISNLTEYVYVCAQLPTTDNIHYILMSFQMCICVCVRVNPLCKVNLYVCCAAVLINTKQFIRICQNNLVDLCTVRLMQQQPIR